MSRKAMTHLVVLAKLCLRKSSEDFLQHHLYVPEWVLADLQLRRHLTSRLARTAEHWLLISRKMAGNIREVIALLAGEKRPSRSG